MRSDDQNKETIKNSKDKNPTERIEEGIDYYLNDAGLMVFTATYHLKRGYCCGNNCKHCPYNNSRRDKN